MPKRIIVHIDTDKVIGLSKKNGWSAATLARKIGKHERWFSEVKRGRNLPSPEEAARMCAILQVMPEEILTEPKDIDLVKGLIESQRSEQTEKPAPLDGDGLSDKDKRVIAWFRSLPLEKQKALLISQDGPEELAD